MAKSHCPSFEEPPYTNAVVANWRESNFCEADLSQAHLPYIDLSEWDYYIKNHYELIKDRYPGISNYRSYMVVIGRKTEASVGGRNPEAYRHYMAFQYPGEVCFYEDLLDKAKQAYTALAALGL